jgi:DNA segregation ATPase FtsK/SpoIIIE, S-DNA-T family
MSVPMVNSVFTFRLYGLFGRNGEWLANVCRLACGGAVGETGLHVRSKIMAITDTRLHTLDSRPPSAAGRVSGQIGILTGLLLLSAVAYCFACLATWSVGDPSLSNANSRIPVNAGGYIGATIADLMMQFTGLASVVALVPPALWAWLKIRQRPIGRLRARFIAWLPSVLLAAAALGAFGKPQAWPLPTGLGGVAGDLMISLPAYAFGGFPTGLLALPLAFLFALPAFALTLFAAGLWLASSPPAPEFDPETGEFLDDDSEAHGSPGLVLGALAHSYYTLRSRIRRRRQASNREPRRGLWRRLFAANDDGLEVPAQFIAADHPREPSFEQDYNPEFIRAPEGSPEYGELVYGPGEAGDEGWELAVAPVDPAHQAMQPGLVQPMRRRLQPGRRQSQESQSSFIDSDRFELPALHFLSEAKGKVNDSSLSTDALEQNARLLEGVLEDFGVKGEIINVRPGPVVTLYELEPAPGIKSSRVIGLADDIARSMSAIACRVAVVPGRNAIGIELPNNRRETVYLRELLASHDYETSKGSLPLVLGKTIGGEPVIADLARMPHLLVAGTTGSGKSVAINTMILSVLYRLTPEQVKLIMIDPKMLELSIYDGIPHLLTPVVTDPKKAVVALKWTVREMEERYKRMSKLSVRNIDGYNARLERAAKKGERLTRTIQTGYDRETGEAIYETEQLDFQPMAYIVVIIDEMADLMMVAGKDIEGAIQRLAQMARAAGIHVIMATQRPSVDVITGTIKANFPTRISFQVTSKIDSRTILGEQGAEQLLGMGDMLHMAGGGRIKRVHGPFVSEEEVEKVVTHLKAQGIPQYLEAVTEESEDDHALLASGDAGGIAGGGESNDLYDQAVAVVLRDRKVSTSYVQRRLGIGYNRAASLIERMEEEQLIGPANHAGKREILVPGDDETI